jgi:hypothetical protein
MALLLAAAFVAGSGAGVLYTLRNPIEVRVEGKCMFILPKAFDIPSQS